MVQKAFFDYSKTSALGKEVGKRFIPFYSFVSKNMQYWPEAMTDVGKLGRLNTALTASRQLGSGPAERDPDIGMAVGAENSYASRGYPQLAAGNGDFKTLLAAPKISFFDSLAMYTDPTRTLQTVNPLMRVPFELAFKYDLNSKQPMDPSKNPFGQKNWLGQAGYTGLLLNQIEPNFTADFSLKDLVQDTEGSAGDKMSRLGKGAVSAALGVTSVKENPKTGTPETTSAWPMYYNKINEVVPFVPPLSGAGTLYNAANTPVARSAAKHIENLWNEDNEKKRPVDIFTNLLAPFDTLRMDERKLDEKQRKIERGK